MASRETVRAGGRRLVWLLPLVGIVAVAFNLRTVVTSVGPFLDEITGDLGMGGTVTGVLTALPVVCFAAFGALAPALATRFGARRVVAASMVVVAVGLAARAAAPTELAFFAASAVALGGVAVSNVLVPVLVRQYFPNRIGAVTGVYTMALSVGTALAAALTVPIAGAAGTDWRGGLGVWAVTALLALAPWLIARAPDAGPGRRGALPAPSPAPDAGAGRRGALPAPSGDLAGQPTRAGPGRRIFRSPTAWALTIFFGTQSLGAYVVMGWMPQIFRDAGLTATDAGLLLALTTGLGIPVALVLPAMAARFRDQRVFAAAMTVILAAGYAGVAFAPATMPWLWATLIGLGNGAFPLALVMIGLRTRSAGYTAALSGMTQSGGYLLAAAGPLAFGVLHDATGGWTIPMALIGVVLVPQFVAGIVAGRDTSVEDEIGPEPARVPGQRRPLDREPAAADEVRNPRSNRVPVGACDQAR